MKNKWGSGNLEMVISFIFFIGFVIFLFLFLKPGETNTLSGAVISELHDTFENEVYTNLSSLFLKSNYVGNPTDCFYIELPQNIFEYPINDGDSYVVLLTGTAVESNLISQDLNVRNDGEFFRVAISPEFEDGSLNSCNILNDYQLGSIVEKRVISYSALENMRDEYYSDYSSLRSRLGVPPIYDFAIIPEKMTELRMIPKLGIPSSVEVIARDYVFKVLKSDGTFNNQRINFRIW